MWGAAIYGLLGAVWMFLFGTVAPQPAGSVVLWGLFALYGAWGATITWRRTGLPFATAAVMIETLVASALAVWAVRGWPFPSLPPGWPFPMLVLMILGALLLIVESRVHRSEWARWKSYAEDKNAWDIVLGRHVPDFRASDLSSRGRGA